MVNYLVFKKTRSLREQIFNRVALPSVLLYRDLFKNNKLPWGESRESLERFNEGTLGKELSIFLYENSINIQPKMENHDVFHVILGYNTTLPEEAALHFFLIGNNKKSRYAMIAALVGFAIFPEYISLYRSAYLRGKNTCHFTSWEFKDLLFVDLEEFRRDIGLVERVV